MTIVLRPNGNLLPLLDDEREVEVAFAAGTIGPAQDVDKLPRLIVRLDR